MYYKLDNAAEKLRAYTSNGTITVEVCTADIASWISSVHSMQEDCVYPSEDLQELLRRIRETHPVEMIAAVLYMLVSNEERTWPIHTDELEDLLSSRETGIDIEIAEAFIHEHLPECVFTVKPE